MDDRHTVLHALAVARDIRRYEAFAKAYERAAQALRDQGQSPAPMPVARHYERLLLVGGVKTQPHPSVASVLERMFQRPVRELLRPASELAQQNATSPVTTAPALNERDLEMTAQDAAGHAGEAASQSLHDMTLDQLAQDIAALAGRYGSVALTEVYRDAETALRTAQVMLERTRKPRQQTRLYLAAGEAAALLSAASFDIGALRAAIQFARTAVMYGDVIDHGPLQAYARGMVAFMEFWAGRPSEAVRLAQQAQQEYGGLGDTARRRLYAIEARAHGHLGDAEQAERAIRATLEQGSGARDELHDDIGGEFGFDAARTAMSNATTLLLLRDPHGAETAAGEAVALLSSRPQGERPAVVFGPAAIDLARARLLRDEVEGAQEALAPVFQIPLDWRGAGMLERLAATRVELTRPGLRTAPAAVALAERIEEFSALSPSRRLGATSPLAIES